MSKSNYLISISALASEVLFSLRVLSPLPFGSIGSSLWGASEPLVGVQAMQPHLPFPRCLHQGWVLSTTSPGTCPAPRGPGAVLPPALRHDTRVRAPHVSRHSSQSTPCVTTRVSEHPMCHNTRLRAPRVSQHASQSTPGVTTTHLRAPHVSRHTSQSTPGVTTRISEHPRCFAPR